MSVSTILINGQWRSATSNRTFRAFNPQTGEETGPEFPISEWADCEQALAAAAQADRLIRDWPGSRFAEFLEAYAQGIEQATNELAALAHEETGLPLSPRLQGGELPRTVNQLRAAAETARSGSWAMPVVDSQNQIYSVYRSLGPVFTMGPNNFPFAFNSISGGDFAAAVAAGNPVIAKMHPLHPQTTSRLAEIAWQTAQNCGFPEGFIQLLPEISPEDGLRMIRDPRLAAVGFTGSRSAGMKIKAVADEYGKPAYLEMSSINPVFILSGALQERGENLVSELTTSCLMGTGQFCTNPGLIVLPASGEVSEFVDGLTQQFAASSCGPLFSAGGRKGFLASLQQLQQAGAARLTGGQEVDKAGFYTQSTLLKITAEQFLAQPEQFQQEAFGNSTLLILTDRPDQMIQIADLLHGQLTGCVYLTEDPSDELVYQSLEPVLRRKVGRLLNNKMPTGVAVSPAMNHGGPFPATGHPGFTAVGLPAAVRRFGMLQCYDNIPVSRLPEILRNQLSPEA